MPLQHRKLQAGNVRTAPPQPERYRQLSLEELVSRVVEHADVLALHELHDNRRPCKSKFGDRMRITEHIRQLAESRFAIERCGDDPVVLGEAIGLTLDKFSTLPRCRTPRHKNDGSITDRSGIDCRLYFKAFLKHVAANITGRSDPESLAREASAAVFLQRFIARHFRLSCLECRRRAPGPVRRFVWRNHSTSILLWFPATMSSRECRAWLDEHVHLADGTRPVCRSDVQAVIDERLLLPKIYSLDRLEETVGNDGYPGLVTPENDVASGCVASLADVVAAEKAYNIDRQRPKIRALGKVSLAQLIQRIFQDLSLGEYDQNKVARAFSLTKATLSRFAGAQWNKASDRVPTEAIPDLWLNTAETLAQYPQFAEAVQEAGVWSQVARLAGQRGDAT